LYTPATFPITDQPPLYFLQDILQTYCQICAGAGESAASVVGGALASAVAALSELERLPLIFKAMRRILANLVSKPNEMKYRRLRLENKSVRELIDLEPVLNILTSVGFTKKLCERTLTIGSLKNKTNTKEEVLILDIWDSTSKSD
jgi:hypothetical protein